MTSPINVQENKLRNSSERAGRKVGAKKRQEKKLQRREELSWLLGHHFEKKTFKRSTEESRRNGVMTRKVKRTPLGMQ